MLDASITVAWLLNEPGIAAAELNDILSNDRAIVPAHWPIEVGNALLMSVRRNRLDPQRLERISDQIARLAVRVEPPINPLVILAAIAFAIDRGLTLYDAAYVSLARRSGSRLATLDRAMRQSADRLKIGVVPTA